MSSQSGGAGIFLKDLARVVPGAVVIGPEDIEIAGLEYNSKMIKPGSIFVAISGFRQDGNLFIDDAVARGAVAVVTEREGVCPVPQVIVPNARLALADIAAAIYDYAANKIKICGITGTNGKTTSCFLLRNILTALGKRTGLITSLVYDTVKEKFPAARTTPESLDIHRLLHIMRFAYCTNAVIEISSHALELHRVKNLDIQVAAFTNLTRDHLDFHKTMDEYLEAKAKLLSFIVGPQKWAVINYDSPEFRSFIPRLQCSHLTYSMTDSKADVYYKSFTLRPDGTRFELQTPVGAREIDFRLPGRYNLYNALTASASALASGADIDAIVRGLENSTTIPGRLERIESRAPFSVFIDYAHTPDALTRTIETLREICPGRILTLFGCGGDRDRGKRPLMGKAATEASDYSVLTSDNPRSEDPRQIINEVMTGIENGTTLEIIEDRAEAIAHIISRAADGDSVLLAGKGVENYQEIEGVRHPFSDRQEALKGLQKRGYV